MSLSIDSLRRTVTVRPVLANSAKLAATQFISNHSSQKESETATHILALAPILDQDQDLVKLED